MYKALKSFSGIKISMAKGQEKEITDPGLIQDLLRAGYIEEIIINDEIKEISEEEAVQKGLYNVIGKEIDNKYIDILKGCVLNQEIIKQYGKDLKIVYTPLHGAGNEMSQRILKELGLKMYMLYLNKKSQMVISLQLIIQIQSQKQHLN